jgi:hypothetical protein
MNMKTVATRLTLGCVVATIPALSFAQSTSDEPPSGFSGFSAEESTAANAETDLPSVDQVTAADNAPQVAPAAVQREQEAELAEARLAIVQLDATIGSLEDRIAGLEGRISELSAELTAAQARQGAATAPTGD